MTSARTEAEARAAARVVGAGDAMALVTPGQGQTVACAMSEATAPAGSALPAVPGVLPLARRGSTRPGAPVPRRRRVAAGGVDSIALDELMTVQISGVHVSRNSEGLLFESVRTDDLLQHVFLDSHSCRPLTRNPLVPDLILHRRLLARTLQA